MKKYIKYALIGLFIVSNNHNSIANTEKPTLVDIAKNTYQEYKAPIHIGLGLGALYMGGKIFCNGAAGVLLLGMIASAEGATASRAVASVLAPIVLGATLIPTGLGIWSLTKGVKEAIKDNDSQ